MSVLLVTHDACRRHDGGPGAPERPARLDAVRRGVATAGVEVVEVAARRATRAEVEAVHLPGHVDEVEAVCRTGGRLDLDTSVEGPESFEAALRAAGAGLDAVARLEAGEADAAFCAVRPPGHHARPAQSMGFCLFNNVAVVAAHLADRGERVLVVDWDAHHGNGTQDAFWADPRVVVASLHQHPLYPGTGLLHETGAEGARGTTVNVPLPAGTSGDAYRRAVDEVLAPLAEELAPTWLLVSAGFDAHRADPITDMGLSAGDFADLTERVAALAPPGRRIAFLEGGYDLAALEASTAACVAALAGERLVPEPPTSGQRGHEVVMAAWEEHRRSVEGG